MKGVDMGIIYSNTSSKVKPKLKPKSERDAYAAWCAKHGINPNSKRRKKEPLTVSKSPVVVTGVMRRETVRYPSLDTGHVGAVTTGKTKNVYTGDKMLGIAVMHKSNLVPIFTEENAVDVSRMRRG
jgi:hypothetical protein